MTSKSLYRFGGIILLFAVLFNILVSIASFFVDNSLEAPVSETQLQWEVISNVLRLIAYALILIGLPAFYLSQSRGKGGKTGFFGLLSLIVFLILHIAMSAYFISAYPILNEQAPNTIKEIFLSSFAFFAFGGTLFALIGFILLGIASIQAKIYPTYVGVLLIIFPLLAVADFITSLAIISLIGSLILAIPVGVVGSRLASKSNFP